MNRLHPMAVTLSAAALALLAGCSSDTTDTSADTATSPEATASSTPAHWEYEGEEGTEHWSELDESYAACSDTVHQSPVDLPAAVPAGDETVELADDTATGTVADSGHALQFTSDETGEGLVYDGIEYHLVQFHVHTPSEHTVDGEPARAEVHLVHKSADGEHTLVLGVLVDEGESGSVWQDFVDAATASEEGDAGDLTVQVADLLPSSLDFYTYEGSLTTPPCTEGVRWVVMSTPVTMTAEQLDALAEVHSGNARPTAELGEREITGGTLSVEE